MVRCIIADDEQPARELMQMHLSQLQHFELAGIFDNAMEAFIYLQRNSVDLAFLDIQMPKISGLDLIKSLKTPPKIILTTAFREHAVEAFELDVLDYLIKPITQERFLKAISKFNYYKDIAQEKKAPSSDTFDNAYIFLKTGREQTKILLRDILYIEGLRDYVKVHTDNKVLIAYERLGYMAERLPENRFLRIHKSFIVAIEKISHYTSEQVTLKEETITIGRIYKKDFFKRFAK